MRYLAVLLLAGCMTPAQMREREVTLLYMKSQPAQAVVCMGRALENYRGDWGSTWREAGKPGHHELIVRTGGETLFVLDAAPNASGGSDVEMYSRPMLLPPIFDAAVEAMAGC